MKLNYSTCLRGLPVVALALLASCGGGYGGGGGMTKYPPATTPSPMTTPPSMTTPPPMSEQYVATLNGRSEVPPNPSPATGNGTLTVDTTTRSMTASITTAGIAGTIAHIHEGAVGVSGPVVFPMTQSYAGSGMWSTTVMITEAQLATLRAGNYYFNVHSAAYPDGEIRGQIRLP